MKLVPCPSCAKELSPQAVSCPHCGHPMEASISGNKPASPPSKKEPYFKIKLLIWALLILVLWLMTSNSPNRINTLQFNKSDFGTEWGLKADKVSVLCKQHRYENGTSRPHVLIETNGKTYALNGAAMGSELYTNAREIMIRDGDGAFTAKGPKEILERGLKLCD